MRNHEEELLEWAEHYMTNKDSVLRRILSIEKQKERLTVKYKDETEEQVIPLPDLAKADIASLQQKATLVTLNTKANLEILITQWKQFAASRLLTIIFCNPTASPDSELESKWVIKPYVHSMICDEKNIKTGLVSMFQMVDQVKP